MGILIDTSVVVLLERGQREPSDLLEQTGEEPVFLAAVSASELLHGVHRADTALRRGRRSAFVESVLASVPVLPFDLEVARVHSRLWADLQARGETTGAHDLLIAATALHHGYSLLTDNTREFSRVPSLKVIAWRRDEPPTPQRL